MCTSYNQFTNLKPSSELRYHFDTVLIQLITLTMADATYLVENLDAHSVLSHFFFWFGVNFRLFFLFVRDVKLTYTYSLTKPASKMVSLL